MFKVFNTLYNLYNKIFKFIQTPNLKIFVILVCLLISLLGYLLHLTLISILLTLFNLIVWFLINHTIINSLLGIYTLFKSVLFIYIFIVISIILWFYLINKLERYNIFNIPTFLRLVSDLSEAIKCKYQDFLFVFKSNFFGGLLLLLYIIIFTFIIIILSYFLYFCIGDLYYLLLEMATMSVDANLSRLELKWGVILRALYRRDMYKFKKILGIKILRQGEPATVWDYKRAVTLHLILEETFSFLCGEIFLKDFLSLLFNNSHYLFLLFLPSLLKSFLIFLLIKFLVNLILYFLNKLDFFKDN